MNITACLDRLERVHKSGAGYTAKCPGPNHKHGDRKSSLSITEGDEGRILFKCFAGCTFEEICAAMGWKPSDLFSRNGHRDARNEPRVNPPAKGEEKDFRATDADVERMQMDLAKNPPCQRYIEGRGISLKVATDLKWGFTPSWSFKDEEGNTIFKPALAIPHHVHGRLVGIKVRTIDGTKQFSQMPGSSTNGLYGQTLLNLTATTVAVFEGPEDCALAISHGLNAVAVNSASSTLAASDIAVLKRFQKIYLIGDMDIAGQKCMDAIATSLPPEQTIRVRLRGLKDIGELYVKAPAEFARNLKDALRVADIQRPHFTWDDLETESELLAGGTGKLPHLVETMIPLDDCTMIAGKEGSLKTLLALYFGKCVANGAPVFGRFQTVEKPVLYLDAENHKGTHEVYLRFFQGIGPKEIRFRTLRYGVPSLTDPALLRICEEQRPLLILDSLIRFGGKRDRDSSEMTELMEQIARLVTAGATVILIHHTRRSDEEEYANSFAIGATVAFLYAIVKDESGLVKRVRMIHKKARASVEINRDLIAFPSIIDRGMFELDSDPYQADLDNLLEFVKAQPGSECSKEAIKNRKGKSHSKNIEQLNTALQRGLLVQNGRKISVPEARDVSSDLFSSPTAGTDGDA
jgi:hypothetical protein